MIELIAKVVISREQALAAGLGKFYTGLPCRHGHVAERYASNKASGKCVQCVSERFKKRYRGDPNFRTATAARVRSRWAADAGFRSRQAAYKNRKRGMPEPARPQPSACEMCGRIAGKKSLHLDHCHGTGKFRGWLCSQCNTGLGLLGDSIIRLKAAVKYLEHADAL